MCLMYTDRPLEREGVAYKIVRVKNEDGIYLPQWKYFYKSEIGGGVDYPSAAAIMTMGGYYPNTITWKIGKTNRSLHGKVKQSQYGGKYRAGIHLYKSLKKAKDEMKWWTSGSVDAYTILKCKYKRAVAEDGNVIVALEVTPVLEIPYKPRAYK